MFAVVGQDVSCTVWVDGPERMTDSILLQMQKRSKLYTTPRSSPTDSSSNSSTRCMTQQLQTAKDQMSAVNIAAQSSSTTKSKRNWQRRSQRRCRMNGGRMAK